MGCVPAVRYTDCMAVPVPVPVPIPVLPEHAQAFTRSPELPGGAFHNPWNAPPLSGPLDVFKWKALQTNPLRSLKRSRTPWLPAVASGPQAWAGVRSDLRVQWLGHASILAEVQGLRVLIDPVFGAAGPGVYRAVRAPVLPAALPPIDVILLSHGHYDHLDRRSIAAVRARNPDALVLVPKGQKKSIPGSHKQVAELSWFESVTVRHIECILTPAQHWHLRRPWDKNRALWGGWMVRGFADDAGHHPSVFHSGDTGWFNGFSVIRSVLGAPDVAVLPLGAYEPRWFMGGQHMPPEDSCQAFLDLGARHFVGMHWGTFDLSDEPIDHGARDILPEQVETRGLDIDRIHLLSHGGVLGVTPGRAQVDAIGRWAPQSNRDDR